eukprot:gene13503-biopygen10076
MKQWRGTTNMSAVLSKASFIEINNRLEDAAAKTFNSISLQSREITKEAYGDVGIKEDKDGILDIAVSYDGAWQRRGHVSHNAGAMEVEAAKNLWERSVEQHKLSTDTNPKHVHCPPGETLGASGRGPMQKGKIQEDTKSMKSSHQMLVHGLCQYSRSSLMRS